ncbi:MAG TPA: response regulator transcription factor [Bryobacteraceae bacterium]|jgi:DNA-binding NarL/FixJ family response regulator|nr:response regulator transcription factor [Bryobacteraceae bacterium]
MTPVEYRAEETPFANVRDTVVLIDTQPLMVEGIRHILLESQSLQFGASLPDISVAAEYVRDFAPRVLVIDKACGMQLVLDLLENLKHFASTSSVVWASMISEAEALRLLQAGAKGIARKTSPADKLLRCLETVAAGHTWMDDTVLKENNRPDHASRSELTAREQQVMHLVEQGLKNKEIGRQLGIRPGTVKIHLKHIFEKTGVRGRYGLALTGLRERGVLNELKM